MARNLSSPKSCSGRCGDSVKGSKSSIKYRWRYNNQEQGPTTKAQDLNKMPNIQNEIWKDVTENMKQEVGITKKV
ncbi:unnamed protein product [Acanthoscelides obtectus]|uniref:Uncharacterized protein n=1 Tax=Acanthoscelides obtectus TaxID=200917 RepID=A0A9P0M2E2_ACAOB|nr:unnamed protein product [Acanthoscelides obtectus]CAK1664891.1 hypothetical protein AOBTE_LOCUS24527 [Acanthoscelides obtectus]